MSAAQNEAEWVIRLAQTEDRADWAELRRELWPQCSRQRHLLEIEQVLASSGVVALACVRGEPVGFAEVSLRHDHVEEATITPIPYLEGWYVAKSHRRQGIGTALVAFVEQWSREHGFQEIASDAESANLGSRRMHLRLGFREGTSTVHFIKAL